MTTQNPEIHHCDAPDGNPIANGGETSFTEVFLSVRGGLADSGWEMVHNMGYAKPFQLNSSGAETVHMENLVPGENLFQVREHSSASPISQWVVNVKEVTAELTIDSLKGLISGVEILPGTSTPEKLFALSGKARANATIDLHDNDDFLAGPIAVDANRNWTYNTGTQATGSHSYTVIGKYDSGPESTPPRTLTVTELSIDQSKMLLDAYKLFSNHGWIEKEVAGNVETRQARGGVQPYIYQPLDPSVVSVSSTGKVAGLRSGQTVIQVTDQTNTTVQFAVEVKNVFQVVKSSLDYPGYAGHLKAQQWVQSVGGTMNTAPMDEKVLKENFLYLSAQVFDGLVHGEPGAIHIVTYGVPYDGFRALNISMLPDDTMWYSLGWVDIVSRAMAFVPR